MKKAVIITGGSSGIGLNCAIQYAHQGWNVGIIGRSKEKLDKAVSHIQSHAQDIDQLIIPIQLDVSNKASIDDSLKHINETLGVPDVIILSAGIVQSIRFDEQAVDDFEQMQHTNLFGSVYLAKALIPQLKEKGRGHICFVSSLAGLIPVYGYSAYSASKFAVMGLAGALRQELKENNIGVSILCPPEVDTPMKASESAHILPQTRLLKNVAGTLNAESVARATISGIEKNKAMIIPGFMAKLVYLQSRYAPRLFSSINSLIIKWASKKQG